MRGGASRSIRMLLLSSCTGVVMMRVTEVSTAGLHVSGRAVCHLEVREEGKVF